MKVLSIVYSPFFTFLFEGRAISTKAVGSMSRDDITFEYKYKDGSIFESGAVRNAMEICQHPMSLDKAEGIIMCSFHCKKNLDFKRICWKYFYIFENI